MKSERYVVSERLTAEAWLAEQQDGYAPWRGGIEDEWAVDGVGPPVGHRGLYFSEFRILLLNGSVWNQVCREQRL